MTLVLENISKSFCNRSLTDLFFRRQKKVTVLKEICLTAYPGEVLALLGPNGAGKTTLLKILASLIEPDSGRAMAGDLNISREPEKAKEIIGFVNTNDRSFYWRLTVQQNLEFFARLHNLSSHSLKRRVAHSLNIVGLADKASVTFATLSAGQRQKLAIARALLNDSSILLFDEPTNSLDPTSSKALLQFVRQELVDTQQKTVIWCTHLLHEAEKISDRFAFLHHGKIIHMGKKEDLQQTLKILPQYTLVTDKSIPQGCETNIKITESTIKNGLHHTLILSPQEHIPGVLKMLLAQNIKVFEVQKSNQNLETIFNRLFGATSS